MAGRGEIARRSPVQGSQGNGGRPDRRRLGRLALQKRLARPGGGKSGGYRTLLSAKLGQRYVFLLGFSKSDKANITHDEKKALQFAGKVFLELAGQGLSKALKSGVLLEVHCEQDH